MTEQLQPSESDASVQGESSTPTDLTPEQIAAGLRSQFQVQLPSGLTYPDDIIRAIFYLFRGREPDPIEIEAWRAMASDELANFIEGYSPSTPSPTLGPAVPGGEAIAGEVPPAAEEVIPAAEPLYGEAGEFPAEGGEEVEEPIA